MIFALVDDAGVVINRIELEEEAAAEFRPPAGQLVADELGASVIGGNWDGAQFAPPPLPAAEPVTHIDGETFLARVTDQEYAAVMAAASQSATIARWIELVRIRGYVNVASAAAQAAKQGLVAAGLLTASRAEVIFAPLQEGEAQ